MQCGKDSDIVVMGIESYGNTYKGIAAGVYLVEKGRELTAG